MDIDKKKMKQEIEYLWNKKKYLTIIDKLKGYRKQDEERYFEWMITTNDIEYVSAQVNCKAIIPISKLISIANDDDLPYEKKINWFHDWSFVNLNTALLLFNNEIYENLKDDNAIIPFLCHYCKLLKQIPRSDESKKKLQKVEGIINEQVINDDVTRGNLLKEIALVWFSWGFYEKALGIIEKYSKIIPHNEIIYCFCVLNKSNNIDHILGALDVLKRYKNMEPNIESVISLLPPVKRLITGLLPNSAQNTSCDDPQIIFNELEHLLFSDINYNKNLCLDNYSKSMKRGKNILSEYRQRFQTKDLIIESTKREGYVLEEMIEELEFKYLGLLFDNCSKTVNRVLENNKYIKYMNWDEEQISSLLKSLLTEEAYIQCSRYSEVLRHLKSAEWCWENNKQIIYNEFPQDIGQDLTYILVEYYKTIELFLYHKLIELAEGKSLNKLPGKNKRAEIIIGDHKYESTSVGNYAYFIFNNPNGVLKDVSNNEEVKGKIIQWSKNCRNAHLHKDPIINVYEATNYRANTIDLINFLAEKMC